MGQIERHHKMVSFASFAILIILLVVWFIKFKDTNTLKYKPVIEYYSGTVDIGNNFFFDADENPDGYSLKVESAKAIKYQDFLDFYNIKVSSEDEYYTKPEYVYDLEITVTNNYNTDGYIFAGKYCLYNNSLQLPINHELWNLIAPEIDGYQVFKVKKGTHITVHLPFTAMPADQLTNSKEVTRRILNEEFYLCISEFPVTKMLSLETD